MQLDAQIQIYEQLMDAEIGGTYSCHSALKVKSVRL
jgi:hypothetical protein